MNCEEIKEYLYEYHMLRLNQETFYKVDEHLKTCERCRQELKELEETINLLNRAKPPEISKDFKDRVMARLEPDMIPFYRRKPYRLVLQSVIAAVVVLAVATTIRLTSQPQSVKESLTRGVVPGVVSSDECKKAIELYNAGTTSNDLVQKERLLNDALAQQCDDNKIQAKIYNNLADCYEKKGDVNQAIDGYKKAIELDPDLATPYISLGGVYKKQGNLNNAAKFYELGIALREKELSKKKSGSEEKRLLSKDLDQAKEELKGIQSSLK